MTQNSIHQNTTSDRKQSDVLYSPAPHSCRGHGNKAIIFILGFAIGFGSFWLWDKNNSVSSDRNEDKMIGTLVPSKENKTVIPNKTENNSISIISQAAGNLVVITEVQDEQPTWVAIHEDVDGKPANILGAQLFDAGAYSGTVSLLRNTEPGHKYYAILYKDNGDRMFDYTTDLPLEQASTGGLISASFTTLSESPPL